MGGTLYFVADDGTSGSELWKSDGTAAGTVRVADIFPGSGSGAPYTLAAVGSQLYFAADDGSSGVELWKSDGTTAGTVRVSDVTAGSEGSYPQNITAMGGLVYFVADGGVSGNELWKNRRYRRRNRAGSRYLHGHKRQLSAEPNRDGRAAVLHSGWTA